MKRIEKITAALSIVTALSHIFCCGLPLALSILSFLGAFGVVNAEAWEPAWLHTHEADLFIFSGVMLLIAGLSQLVSWRANCRTDGMCTHEPCEPKKGRALHIFYLAFILYAVSLAVYFGAAH